MQGWIKLHRKLKQWEWYQQSEMVHLFIHLLLGTNHQDNKWQGVDVKKGQIITGRKQLSMETGLSEQKIRTCLIKLKSTSDITIQSTNRFSLITICNWGTYQCDIAEINQPVNQPTHTPATNNQPTVNQQSTTNKNVKNDKKEKKTEFPAELDFPEFHKAWQEWAQHRTEIKHKLTPTTILKQLKMLAGNKTNAVAIIDKSIEKGWMGLFEIDEKPETEKICVIDRKPGLKYQTNRKSEKVYLCQECFTAFTKSGASSWGHLRPSKIEEIVLKHKGNG
jgi:hypothetical protein